MKITEMHSVFGKSSYALRRENVWQAFMNALEDCRSFVALDLLKEEWEIRAREEHWNEIFISEMHEEFEKAERALADFEETALEKEMVNINNAFPSNYLKAADLQGTEPTLVISKWTFERMGDDEKLVIYFQGKEKGMVLNKTNATNIASLYGPETDGWIGKQIKLVMAYVDFQGRSVEALRVRPPASKAAQEYTERNPPPADSHDGPDDDMNDSIPF